MAGNVKHRFVIGGISHESNTFSNSPTTLDDFKRQSYNVGQAILSNSIGRGVVGGFIDIASQRGVELLPTLQAGTTPKGPVTKQAFDSFQNRGCIDR